MKEEPSDFGARIRLPQLNLFTWIQSGETLGRVYFSKDVTSTYQFQNPPNHRATAPLAVEPIKQTKNRFIK